MRRKEKAGGQGCPRFWTMKRMRRWITFSLRMNLAVGDVRVKNSKMKIKNLIFMTIWMSWEWKKVLS